MVVATAIVITLLAAILCALSEINNRPVIFDNPQERR